ncbi:MAG: ATP-binding protein [Acetobacteraceae bacterium]|nr:ATP-binding protein [Acetobacteraceae bacterium]
MNATGLATVAVAQEPDILVARRRAREVAALLGFEPQDQTRIATAASEIARNAATHGGGGRVEFAFVAKPRPGLRLVVRDTGPGIAQIEAVLEGRVRGAGGTGTGIASTRRLMDEFDIETSRAGTCVTLTKFLPRQAPPLTPATVARIAQTLAARAEADPGAEARLQNRELLQSLAALTAKQEESERLNEELATTNRGVVALYAELDEKAAQLATLNTELESRVAAAVADYQRVNDALRQSQKMEAVGQLTGGIAHDFNNLLQIVAGNLELVLRRLPPDDVWLRRAVGNAMSGAQRAATLTQRLLAFSRRQPLAPKPVDLNRLVDGLLDLMRRTLGETVSIRTEPADDLWTLEADANQLENALLNLAVNARDAMLGGGTLTITTANARIGPGDVSDDAEPGDYVSLTVSDTGTGMPEEIRSRVFEPFFTTKEVGKGTGLGLSMVYGFAKQSGGHLRLESELGRGTAVTLFLPRCDGAAARVSSGSAVPVEAARPHETILVVEDDAEVRTYSCDVLTELGYQVLVAADGPAAVELLEGSERIDLVFTDLVLAGPIDGRKVAEHAAATRPGTPVLFTSGYAHDIITDARPDPSLDLLAKPFSYTALAQRVRQAIARAPAPSVRSGDPVRAR